MRHKLLLAYDGTAYVGWQRQPSGVSIQEVVEGAIETIVQKPVRVTGAGRTDAGVHALGQVAHFDCEKRLFAHNLNALLTPDIRVLECEPTHSTFHSIRDAERKTYHYHLALARPLSPFERRYRHAPRFEVDLERMEEAAGHMVGRHDFATFANVGSSAKTTTRTVYRVVFVEEEGGVRIEFEGDGFLYKMVRNLTGTLLEVGRGARAPGEIPELLAKRNRRVAGPPAPACGLFLAQIALREESAMKSEEPTASLTASVS